MATIPGAHLFDGNAPGFAAFTAIDTSNGTTDAHGHPLSADTLAGNFNLEVFIGAVGTQPPIAPGFQGLAVQSINGTQIDLISGAYAVSDPLPGGGDILNAHGANETVQGSPGDNLVLYGSSETALGFAGDTITVWGTGDRVDDATLGSGGNDVAVFGAGNTVIGGSSDTIAAYAANEDIAAGPGASVAAFGGFDTIDGSISGTATGTVNAYGSNATLETGGAAGGGAATSTVFNVFGIGNTLVDSGAHYTDTVTGFSPLLGDTIHLASGDTVTSSAQVNNGQDTLVMLSDSSTILLKGVTHIDGSFFS